MKHTLRPPQRLFAVLAIIATLGIAAYSYVKESPWYPRQDEQALSDAKDHCSSLQTRVEKEITRLRRHGWRTTDPRLLYGPAQKQCYFTYLLLDPSAPEAKTFNTFVIQNIRSYMPIRLSTKETLNNWSEYQKRISELERN